MTAVWNSMEPGRSVNFSPMIPGHPLRCFPELSANAHTPQFDSVVRAICRNNPLTKAILYVWNFPAMCNQRLSNNGPVSSQGKVQPKFSVWSFLGNGAVLEPRTACLSESHGEQQKLGSQTQGETSKLGRRCLPGLFRIVSLDSAFSETVGKFTRGIAEL